MKRCINCFNEYEAEYDVCMYCGYTEDTEENPIYRLPHGTILHGRYILGKTLGQGGFAITYLAWDTKWEKKVAIKEHYPVEMVNRSPGSKNVILVAKKKRKEYESNRKRFLDEARNATKFSGHKNIVEVFDYFEENNTAYMIMEILTGDIKQYLDKHENGRLEEQEAVQIISDVCEALKEIHDKDIVHRDIAPDNIMLNSEGNVKLIDFGAAEFSDGSEKPVEIVLKPGYAPPEQYEKISKIGPWNDIYALGATMYRMVTGYTPTESTNRVTEDKVPYPNEIPGVQINENLNNAIMKAMAVEVHMRFNSIKDFQKAIVGEKPVAPVEKEKKWRKRRRVIQIASAAVCIVIASVIFKIRWDKNHLADLNEAEIQIWYEVDGQNSYTTSYKDEAVKSIAKEFEDTYKKVKVKVVPVNSDEYEQKLEAEIKKDDGCIIFESEHVSEGLLKGTVDASDTIKRNKDLVWCYDELMDISEKTNQLVIGVDESILYVNTIKYQNELSYSQVIENLAIENKEDYRDLESFLNEENTVFFGTSAEYYKIREKMPGKYKMLVDDSCNYAPAFAWSIDNGSDDEVKAAKRMFEEIFYSSNENVRALLFNHADDRIMLPVNIRALDIEKKNSGFAVLNPEFRDLANTTNYTFTK